MAEDDLSSLARHVRELAVAGITEELSQGPDALNEAEARTIALERMTPAELVRVPPALAPDESVLAQGRALFVERCAACHGVDGKGHPETVRPDIDETRNWARDITTGVLKGGARHADLARSIQAGMHGTAMPSTELEEPQMSALLAYVSSLIPPGSEDRFVQRPVTIVARSISGAVPMDPADLAWREIGPTSIVLAPLWWRDGAILEAEVRALLASESLALHLRWIDPTHDILMDEQPPYESPRYADAVAVQFSSLEHPPFFGMREGGEPTHLWHWRAIYPFGPEQLAFAETALRFLHHALGDWQFAGATLPVPVYRVAQGPIEIVGEPMATRPQGMQVLDLQAQAGESVASKARWSDGAWEVVFTGPRALFVDDERKLPPTAEVSLNFAIWNGAIRDLRGQKSVTIWHRLRLAEGGS
jgi:DMSO reductase family type II enzyme heme b subunit